MRLRFVAAFTGVMIVVLAAVGFPLAGYLRDVESERVTSELQRDAFNLASTAEGPLLSGEEGDIANLHASAELYEHSRGIGVVITDADGVVVVAEDEGVALGQDVSALSDVGAALGGRPASGRGDVLFVAVPVRSGAQTVGVVRLTYPTSVADARADDKLRGLAVVGLISLSTAVIAALFMAGTVIAPLRRLQRTTERVSAGDFTGTATADEGPPEVRRLAVSFDTMTTKVAHLLDQQRSFAGDASHQLRTPLTALRLQLERAAEIVESDPDAARSRLEAAGMEVERLQRMVEGLLLLARSDARSSNLEPVDVGAVAVERAEIWRSLAAERDVEVFARVSGECVAAAVPGAVEQIIDNYLDNAIGVSPQGSTVEVVVGVADRWIEAHVMDRGSGMTDAQLRHAFDRFWRAPDAPHEGSGLGLAIVHHLATASRGEVELTSRIGGGVDAVLRLPGASSMAAGRNLL